MTESVKMNFLMPFKGIATKKFQFKNKSWELVENYKAGKYFKGFEIPVNNLKNAYNILKENQKHPVFLIHGAIIDGTDKNKMIRRKRSEHKDGLKPTITDRNLTLFCLDIDGFIIPNSSENLVNKSNLIEYFIQNHLPEPFKIADYIYQYSASYGLTTLNLNCHLFFWLQTPVHNLDIKTWIKQYNKEKNWGTTIDDSILNAAQPIYTQKRICNGKVDPIIDFIGHVEKKGLLNWIPNTDNSISKSTVNTLPIITNTKDFYDLSAGVEKILISENYHEELNKLALSLINKKVPAKTVKNILAGAMNAAKKEITDKKRLNDWQIRFEDIDRSVDSAVDIVDCPTIEEVINWISESDSTEVKANYAQKCIKLSPMDRTTVIIDIVKKIGFGIADIKKTIKIAEEKKAEQITQEIKNIKSKDRKARYIYELEVTAINGGEIAQKAGNILAKSNKSPQVFVMGGNLASVNLGIPRTIRQCSKLSEMGEDYPRIPIIQPYKKPFYSLAGRLESDIIFINEKGNDIEVSTRIIHMIGEAINNNFKPLTGIVEHPFIDNNWKLIQKEGYNEKTGLYTMLHRKLKITKMESKKAYEFLAYVVFDEFPFSSNLDRAVAVAALMTAIQRPTIAGDSGMPGFGIVSPIQSSGKTTLAQLISYSIYNRPVAASSWSIDEEELGKHILAILQEGHSCVLFDNIKQGATIQSGRLANAMSNDIFGGRQLGENKTIEVPSSVLWLFTGNGIKFVGDFATRIYPININPKMEDPNTRIFKRVNIGQWALDNRKKIISAILSIIIEGKGMEPVGSSTRFQLWDEFIRRPLLKVSKIDINEAVKNNQKDDPMQLAKHQLLFQLRKVFKNTEFTTKDIIKQAYRSFEDNGIDETELAEALNEVIPRKNRGSRSIARFLTTMTDIFFSDLSLIKRTTNYIFWSIIKKKKVEKQEKD